MRVLLCGLLLAFPVSPTLATPGGLNAEGCHNDRKGGTGYHCHRGGSARPAAPRRAAGPLSGEGAFPNCAAARAAGAAPVWRGDAGYSARLDRDGDGVACE